MSRQQAIDQFFSGPAAVLTLSHHAATRLVEPYRFTHTVFKSLTECHLYIAECLLDPEALYTGLDEKYQQYQSLIKTLSQETPLRVNPPDEYDLGIKLHTHVI